MKKIITNRAFVLMLCLSLIFMSFSSAIYAENSTTDNDAKIQELSEEYIEFNTDNHTFYLKDNAYNNLTEDEIKQLNQVVDDGNQKIVPPESTEEVTETSSNTQFGPIQRTAASGTLTANDLYGVGDFVFAGVTGLYSICKKVTPIGAFIWVITTNTITCNEGEEEWLKAHENDYFTTNEKKPDSNDLATKIAVVSQIADKVKENIKNYGIETYSDMVKLIQRYAPGKYHSHHLIEQRLAQRLDITDTNKMRAIAVTRDQHQAITNAWRVAVKYIEGTRNASKKEIYDAALKIYKDFPDIIKIIKRAMEVQGIPID